MPADKFEISCLRALEPGDIDLIRTWHNMSEVREGTFAFPFPVSVEAERAWYSRNVAAGDGRNAIFGIRAKPDAAGIVGLVMLRNIDWISRSAFFGIFIGASEARGKGLARDATRAMVSYGFHDLGLNRIALEVAASNVRAIKLYKALGFVHEGVMRQGRFIQGQFIDVDMMAILADRSK